MTASSRSAEQTLFVPFGIIDPSLGPVRFTVCWGVRGWGQNLDGKHLAKEECEHAPMEGKKDRDGSLEVF